ncbi:hypothetical protein X737_36050 [Mesorhizobium sp. L48C026A00]|nr:hypothetical protein X737_36050 [Mesorhizobium sp. L48C026A00]
MTLFRAPPFATLADKARRSHASVTAAIFPLMPSSAGLSAR